MTPGKYLKLTVKLRKFPAAFILCDAAGSESARTSSFQEKKTLIVPAAGGLDTLLATRIGFVTTDGDAIAEAPW